MRGLLRGEKIILTCPFSASFGLINSPPLGGSFSNLVPRPTYCILLDWYIYFWWIGPKTQKYPPFIRIGSFPITLSTQQTAGSSENNNLTKCRYLLVVAFSAKYLWAINYFYTNSYYFQDKKGHDHQTRTAIKPKTASPRAGLLADLVLPIGKIQSGLCE